MGGNCNSTMDREGFEATMGEEKNSGFEATMGEEKSSGFEATMGEESNYEATMGESPKRSPFTFFYTDYDNIEISYSCDEFLWGFFKNERLAITGRTPEIDEKTMDYEKAVIQEKLPWYYE